jgi:hypothetical protein
LLTELLDQLCPTQLPALAAPVFGQVEQIPLFAVPVPAVVCPFGHAVHPVDALAALLRDPIAQATHAVWV